MRVISNVELAEVSGAGWIDDLLELLGMGGGGSSSASSFTCTSSSVTNGTTTTVTNSCSNGTSTVTVTTPTYTTTTIITPGTNVDGSIGAQARVVGGQLSVNYSAPPIVCSTTVINGSSSSTCH